MQARTETNSRVRIFQSSMRYFSHQELLLFCESTMASPERGCDARSSPETHPSDSQSLRLERVGEESESREEEIDMRSGGSNLDGTLTCPRQLARVDRSFLLLLMSVQGGNKVSSCRFSKSASERRWSARA